MKITILYGTNEQADLIDINTFQKSIKTPGMYDCLVILKTKAKLVIESILNKGEPTLPPSIKNVHFLFVITDPDASFVDITNATFTVRCQVEECWMRDIIQSGEFSKKPKRKISYMAFDELGSFNEEEWCKIAKGLNGKEVWYTPVVDTAPVEHINFKKTFEYSWDQIDIPLSDTAQRLKDIIDFERLNPATITPVCAPADMLEASDFINLLNFNIRHRG